MLTPQTIKRIAFKSIDQTHSFVRGSGFASEIAFAKSDETIVGVYINNEESYVVITDRGLSVVEADHEEFVPYSCVVEIREPEEGDRDLDLILKFEGAELRSYAISVLGMTDDYPDIFAFHQFLIDIKERLPLTAINAQDVASRLDLIDYLRSENDWDYLAYLSALSNYLQKDFKPEVFESLNIEPSLLEKPDFWRALAIILTSPVDGLETSDPWQWGYGSEFKRDT